MKENLLYFDRVSMRYHQESGETAVLEDFTLSVRPGEFIALLGPSGCGKSTVLSLAAGLLRPDSGRVTLRGQEIKTPPPRMGYMLQHDHLFDWLTVRDNALVGIRVRGKPTARQLERIDSLLESCGLTDFAQALPTQLSGGMRQRAALVRTLAVEPEFLLLDEPFSALDSQTRIQLADEVKQTLIGSDRATILVTHDVSEAISMADRVIVLTHRPAHILSEHVIELEGSPMQRRRNAQFREYFDRIWKELDVHVQ